MALRDRLSPSFVPSSLSDEEWCRVINHPEAQITAKDMLRAAHTVLRRDFSYGCYRESLQKIAKQNIRVDDLINEVLRFLAIKVLIVGEPVPSIYIQDAWLALVLIPVAYGSVCKALGSPSVVEFQEQSIKSSDEKARRYSRTMESYRVLFKKEPLATLWPVEKARRFNFSWLKEIATKQEAQKTQTNNHSWGTAPSCSSVHSDANTMNEISWDDSTIISYEDDLTLTSIIGVEKKACYSTVFGCHRGDSIS